MTSKFHDLSSLLVILVVVTSCLHHSDLGILANTSINNHQQLNSEDIVFNATSFLVRTVEFLQNHIVEVDGEFLGWPTTINGYDDNYVEIGYRAGFVGIGSYLLQLQELNFIDVKPIISTIVDKLLSVNITDATGIRWPRFSHATSSPWTAIRYGTSGILPFLVRVNETTIIPNLDTVLSKSYQWLKTVQTQGKHYPMSPGGYITTDIEYGATGVLRGMLDLYGLTLNQTYLDEAKAIGTYLLQEGIWNGDQFRVPWTITQGSDFLDVSYKSITSGVTGIMTSLIDLYNATQMIEFKEAAIGIANFLKATQINGGWNNSAVGYVTKMGGNDGLTGYDVGMAGIADSLIYLRHKTGNAAYNEVVQNANTAISSLVYSDGSVGLSPGRKNHLYTGLSMGSAGVSYYYLKYFQESQEEQYLENATRILSRLYDLFISDHIPINERDPSRGYSFNIEHGIAGVGLVLLEFLNVVPSGTYKLEHKEDTVISEPSEQPITQNENELISDRNFQVIVVLWIIMIILILRRKLIKG